jgi:hypothetical protein
MNTNKEWWQIPRDRMSISDVLGGCGYCLCENGRVIANDGQLTYLGRFENYRQDAVPDKFRFEAKIDEANLEWVMREVIALLEGEGRKFTPEEKNELVRNYIQHERDYLSSPKVEGFGKGLHELLIANGIQIISADSR